MTKNARNPLEIRTSLKTDLASSRQFGVNVSGTRRKIDTRLTQALFVACSLLLSTSAIAQDAPKIQDRMPMGFFPDQPDYVVPVEPTEEEKVAALKLAYSLNGGSMVSYGYMIDLTDPRVLKADKIVTAVPEVPVVIQQPKAEDVDWDARRKFMNRTFRATKEQLTKDDDVCSRHGMHKVVTGSSWRCRK